jgi:hypothetical protein
LIEQQSNLVRATATPTTRPDADASINPGDDPFDPAHTDRYTPMPAGQDGDQTEADLIPATDNGTGVYALARADLFNRLCIPPFLPAGNANAGRVLSSTAKGQAAKFCSDHRALFLVDPHPDWTAPSQITGGGTSLDTYVTGISSDDRKNAPSTSILPRGIPRGWRHRRLPAVEPSRGLWLGRMGRGECGRRLPVSTRGSRECSS